MPAKKKNGLGAWSLNQQHGEVEETCPSSQSSASLLIHQERAKKEERGTVEKTDISYGQKGRRGEAGPTLGQWQSPHKDVSCRLAAGAVGKEQEAAPGVSGAWLK